MMRKSFYTASMMMALATSVFAASVEDLKESIYSELKVVGDAREKIEAKVSALDTEGALHTFKESKEYKDACKEMSKEAQLVEYNKQIKAKLALHADAKKKAEELKKRAEAIKEKEELTEAVVKLANEIIEKDLSMIKEVAAKDATAVTEEECKKAMLMADDVFQWGFLAKEIHAEMAAYLAFSQLQDAIKPFAEEENVKKAKPVTSLLGLGMPEQKTVQALFDSYKDLVDGDNALLKDAPKAQAALKNAMDAIKNDRLLMPEAGRSSCVCRVVKGTILTAIIAAIAYELKLMYDQHRAMLNGKKDATFGQAAFTVVNGQINAVKGLFATAPAAE